MGLQADLKNRCPLGREGSNPSLSTVFNPFNKRIRRVYGPYLRKYKRGPARNQILVVFVDGTLTSMSYARWLVVQNLRRRLKKHEHVDHVNGNSQDDRLENLQILTPAENNRKAKQGWVSPLKSRELGWTHGTIYGWMKKRCACKICLAAHRAWHDARNKTRRRVGSRSRGPYKRKILVE